jgi:hypothetical protein
MIMAQEKKYITGETFDQICDRYRALHDDWDNLSFEEKRDRINRFRGGYQTVTMNDMSGQYRCFSCASRGRNPLDHSDRKSPSNGTFQQCLEINRGGLKYPDPYNKRQLCN